jgi:type IV secretory pathway VirB10-like protein
MPFRRRRPIARMATTAVVAGTAAHMGAKSAQRNAAPDQYEDQAPPAPAPADEPAAPEAAESPQVEQIKQLAALKDQGILTEEEFAASKAKILGI